jgi:DNA-binding NarL/FixJ family response regulator
LVARSNPIKVLIADGHLPYSKALKMTLEIEDDIEIVGEANDWETLEHHTRIFKPDVLLIDIRLHDAHGNNDGISVTRQILRHHPHLVVIILTMLPSKELVPLAHHAGARAILSKDDHNDDLLYLIRSSVPGANPPKSSFSSPDHSQYQVEY